MHVRKPFQGVWNIIRFNWHLYVLSGSLVLALYGLGYLFSNFSPLLNLASIVIIVVTGISLAVSTYIYDLSNLYKFPWIDNIHVAAGSKIININAGFDETSVLLCEKLPGASLTVFDFFDSLKHKELSIKRAQKAYPAFAGTLQVKTNALPFGDNEAELIFLIFSAHEIRDPVERDHFFRELKRILKPSEKIVLIEHLRDTLNFAAYNIGFLHFISRSSWYQTFNNAGLIINSEIKINPFVTKFVLVKNGSES